jgi:hypothetical protein
MVIVQSDEDGVLAEHRPISIWMAALILRTIGRAFSMPA